MSFIPYHGSLGWYYNTPNLDQQYAGPFLSKVEAKKDYIKNRKC